MNHILFAAADFLSRPPGFYVMLAAMLVATIVIPFGVDENLVTYVLSVAAIVITGVVLIQGYRDTSAIQAKLDELILAQNAARNEVVGLEKAEPEKIAREVAKREREAKEREDSARKAALTHPIIVEARSLFGGELGPIEVLDG